MILPDTNIWIDHLRSPDSKFTSLLLDKLVRLHPFVLGEIALGLQGSTRRFIELFSEVKQPTVLSPAEILTFIDARKVHGTGIGYVDAHLLASTLLIPGGKLWTRDHRLKEQAERLGVAYQA
jgi:predicted nucleic acid-binding protein